MVINAREIELFKNISQFDWDNVYYDLHNDFDCINITFENGILTLLFKNNIEGYIVSFKFKDAIIIRIEFSKFSELKNLTIDNLYRGRYEKDGSLSEFRKDSKSYFYLEFYEGPKFELWSDKIEIEKVN